MNIADDEWEDELFEELVATAEKKQSGGGGGDDDATNNNRKRDYEDAMNNTALASSASPLYKTKRPIEFASQPTTSQTTRTTTTTLKETLEKYYGYSNFRPGQEEVIKVAIEGRDTCVF